MDTAIRARKGEEIFEKESFYLGKIIIIIRNTIYLSNLKICIYIKFLFLRV